MENRVLKCLTKVNEKQFMRMVIQLAELHRWKVYHTHDSRRSQPGFPDLVLAKAGRPVIYAELKSESGKVRPEQVEWLELLRLTPSQAFVWRPSQLDEITRILGGDL